MRTRVKTATDTPVMDRHAMTDVLNRYIDSLIAEKNQTISGLVTKRNAEIASLQRNLPGSTTSFTTGAAMTAGGYGLGRLAALSKRLGRLRGHRAGLLSAGLTAGGLMLKDRLFPNKVRLPVHVPEQWPDPSAPQSSSPPPTAWQKLRSLVSPAQPRDKQAAFPPPNLNRLPQLTGAGELPANPPMTRKLPSLPSKSPP
jgi:hypothetical protein